MSNPGLVPQRPRVCLATDPVTFSCCGGSSGFPCIFILEQSSLFPHSFMPLKSGRRSVWLCGVRGIFSVEAGVRLRPGGLHVSIAEAPAGTATPGSSGYRH